MALGAIVAWAALVALAAHRGRGLRVIARVRAMPLHGVFARVDLLPMLPAAVIGLALAWLLPRWCARVGWRRVLAGVAVASVLWGVGLAAMRGGEDGVARGMSSAFDESATTPQAEAVGLRRFVDTYSDPAVLAGYPIHAQGHPVGAPLAFVGLDRVGVGTPLGRALVLLVVGASIGPAVLVAAREVVGEDRARRAAPFVVLAPSAIWLVTSSDALYSAVGAWGIALAVLATRPGRAPRSVAILSVASGVVLALGLHLSYGLAPLTLVAAVVVVVRRRWAVVPWAALGAAVVVAGFTAAGFWWFDGLAATHLRYRAGVAERRPGRFFALIGNPAALAVALGPVAAIAVVRVRGWRTWLLPGAALAAVAVADLSGLSKAEVERIWLPFQPWILLLGGGLVAAGGRAGPGRPTWWPSAATGLLALQVAVAVAVESSVRTPW